MPAEEPLRKLVDRREPRKLFVKKGTQWLALDPHRIGMLGASVIATVLLLVMVMRQWAGLGFYDPPTVIVGVLLTFVVSYAAIGIFVFYLLVVAHREFGPQPEFKQKLRSLIQMKMQAEAEGRDIEAVNEQIAALTGDTGIPILSTTTDDTSAPPPAAAEPPPAPEMDVESAPDTEEPT